MQTPVVPMDEVSSESGSSSSSGDEGQSCAVPEFGNVFKSMVEPNTRIALHDSGRSLKDSSRRSLTGGSRRSLTGGSRRSLTDGSRRSLSDVNEALWDGELEPSLGPRASFKDSFGDFRFGRLPSVPDRGPGRVASIPDRGPGRVASIPDRGPGRVASILDRGPECVSSVSEVQPRRSSSASPVLAAVPSASSCPVQPQYLDVPVRPQTLQPAPTTGKWRRKRSGSLPLRLSDEPPRALGPPAIGVTPASPGRTPPPELEVECIRVPEPPPLELELSRDNTSYLVATTQEYVSEFHAPKAAGDHGANEVCTCWGSCNEATEAWWTGLRLRGVDSRSLNMF